MRRSISPPCFGLCQSTLQPFSCHDQNDLSRNPVQHQDGCRRRLSIRQTRRPKPARSFWCLFLKKARLFVTETLVRATRAIQRPLRISISAPRAIRRSLHALAFLRLMQPALYSARHSSRLFCPAPYSARCVLRPPVYALRAMGRSLWLTPRSATGLKIAPVIQRPLRLPPPRTPRHPSPTPAHALHPRNRMRKRFETAL